MDNMTAKMSCFVRAFNYEVSEEHVFDDKYAKAMLGKDYDLIATSLIQGISFFIPGFIGSAQEGLKQIVEQQLAPSVLARSVYCEELLDKQACDQYLLVGAGYDTYFARKKKEVTVFELDYPDLLEDKKKRIEAMGMEWDSILIPCDFSKDNWRKLLQDNGYDSLRKSFASLLGITYYMDISSFVMLISELSQSMSVGSSICFDYQTKEDSEVTKKNRMLANGAKELMKSSYSLEELNKILDEQGFCIEEHVDNEEMTLRYFQRMKAPKGVGYVHAIKVK